jgi:hypothetical protein
MPTGGALAEAGPHWSERLQNSLNLPNRMHSEGNVVMEGSVLKSLLMLR